MKSFRVWRTIFWKLIWKIDSRAKPSTNIAFSRASVISDHSCLSFAILCSSHLQYKVLRGGCWEKVNFESQKLQTNKGNGPHVLLANPWIQHFRSACREQNVLSCDLQERISYGSLEVRTIQKIALAPADLAANMKQFPLCRSDSVGSDIGSSQLYLLPWFQQKSTFL